MQKNRKYRLNNSGMSLVEVIIAMTILSVVVIAVMQSLTMAMVYNKKARAKQDTTIKAESVMELFKGYNMDELYKMFATGGGAVKDMVGDATYSVSGTEPKTGTPTDLEFKIDGLTISSTDGGAGETYDVQIVAKPVPEVALFETQKFDNSKDVAFISDEKYDNDARDQAYSKFINDDTLKQAFADYINATYPNACDKDGNSITKDTITTDLKIDKIFLSERKTVFTIDDAGVKTKMTYRYRIYGYEFYEKVFPEETSDTYGSDEYEEGSSAVATPDPDAYAGELKYADSPDTMANDMEFEVTLDGDDTQIDNANLERLFIYYYPQYEERNRVLPDGSVDKVKIEDKIAIENTKAVAPGATPEPVQCFIIKQKRASLSNASLDVRETHYALKELSTSGALTVYDNFEENISNGERELAAVTGSTYYMDTADKVDNVLSYALELTVTNRSTGSVVTTLTSSTNER